jgi:hypothetical protein
MLPLLKVIIQNTIKKETEADFVKKGETKNWSLLLHNTLTRDVPKKASLIHSDCIHDTDLAVYLQSVISPVSPLHLMQGPKFCDGQRSSTPLSGHF